MRKLILFFTALVIGTSSIMASIADDKVAERNAYRYNKSFIFVENGITFSIYPDGEFDFYLNNRIGTYGNQINFNSGYDYSSCTQYDDYGAVVQIENVPVFYDYYGRVSQIGAVNINYRHNRVYNVGNMFVYYNNRGFYDYHTGYINGFNRSYVYRPFHRYFARPSINFCLVNARPYRRYYNPIRYTYYNPYRYNHRRTYAKIGRQHRYNNVRKERATVYRNDRRVAVRQQSKRGHRNIANSRTQRNVRGNTNKNHYAPKGNHNSRTFKREVTRTPRNTTVTKRTTTVSRKPSVRSTTKTVRKTNARPVQRSANNRGVSARNTTQRSYNKTPIKSSRNIASRSVAPRKGQARSVRTTRSVTSSRSRKR